MLSPSYKYVSNMVSKMIDNGLIAYMRNDAKILRLTKNGLNYLRENDTPLYEFYMKMTNDGQAGHSQRHKELMIKTAGAQASMLMAGIDIGPQKPSLIDIRQNAAAKMNIEDQPTFYMGKEIKYQTGQKVSRSHLSRASGVLFSQGTTALVYNTVDSSIKISTAVENETAMLARVWSAELYNQYLPPGVSIYDSIQLYEIVEREGLELFLHPYFTCSSPYIEPCPFCETGTYCPCSSSSVPISEPPAALSHVCFLYCRDRAQKTWGGEKLVPRAVWVLRHLYRIYPLLDMAPIQETNLCGT